MPIDPLLEDTIPFSEAARRLPLLRADRPFSPATIWRWASHGLRGVRLETVRVGGTRCTSVEALSRFFQALNDSPALPTLQSTPRGDAIGAALDRTGI